MYTQLTACGNHIQFLYIGVRLWADKFQNQLLAAQTILTDGNWQARQLGGWVVWATLPVTGNKVRHMIINLTKLCWQAMSSSSKGKSNKAAATPWALLPKKGAWGITTFRFHLFIKFTCDVCTCVLKHNWYTFSSWLIVYHWLHNIKAHHVPNTHLLPWLFVFLKVSKTYSHNPPWWKRGLEKPLIH